MHQEFLHLYPQPLHQVPMKTAKSKKVKELVMTSNTVYSRAYHKELTRSGKKSRARQQGQLASAKWRALQ